MSSTAFGGADRESVDPQGGRWPRERKCDRQQIRNTVPRRPLRFHGEPRRKVLWCAPNHRIAPYGVGVAGAAWPGGVATELVLVVISGVVLLVR